MEKKNTIRQQAVFKQMHSVCIKSGFLSSQTKKIQFVDNIMCHKMIIYALYISHPRTYQLYPGKDYNFLSRCFWPLYTTKVEQFITYKKESLWLTEKKK